MKRHSESKATHEQAARFGAKANLWLGLSQLAVGVSTGNIGFFTEFIHQAADAGSLQAKAEAMKSGRSPKQSRRLRKLAASVLCIGGPVGILGGINHIVQGTSEGHSPSIISAAVVGAAVNAVIAKKSHGAEHPGDHDHSHQHGAAIDTAVHIFTDMGISATYAGSLIAERWLPGISNAALIANGAIAGTAGVHTVYRIQRDDNDLHDDHVHAEVQS